MHSIFYKSIRYYIILLSIFFLIYSELYALSYTEPPISEEEVERNIARMSQIEKEKYRQFYNEYRRNYITSQKKDEDYKKFLRGDNISSEQNSTINNSNSVKIPSLKNQDKKNSTFSEYYKLEKVNTLMSCIYPNFINGLQRAYIRNSKGDIVYIISMEAVQGVCDWKIDKYIFKTNTPRYIVNQLINEKNNNLYLQETLKIKFTIKKIRNNENLDIDAINLAYFVIINNKAEDDIITQKSYSIKINLPKSGSMSYMSPDLTIDTSFLSKDFLNMEILSGLYPK